MIQEILFQLSFALLLFASASTAAAAEIKTAERCVQVTHENALSLSNSQTRHPKSGVYKVETLSRANFGDGKLSELKIYDFSRKRFDQTLYFFPLVAVKALPTVICPRVQDQLAISMSADIVRELKRLRVRNGAAFPSACPDGFKAAEADAKKPQWQTCVSDRSFFKKLSLQKSDTGTIASIHVTLKKKPDCRKIAEEYKDPDFKRAPFEVSFEHELPDDDLKLKIVCVIEGMRVEGGVKYRRKNINEWLASIDFR